MLVNVLCLWFSRDSLGLAQSCIIVRPHPPYSIMSQACTVCPPLSLFLVLSSACISGKAIGGSSLDLTFPWQVIAVYILLVLVKRPFVSLLENLIEAAQNFLQANLNASTT